MPENENPTLESAVSSAVDSSVSETQETPTEAQQTQETPQETQTQETTQQAEGPSSQEIEQAMNVYRILNDPSTAPHVVRALAEKMGLIQPPVTPKEEKPSLSALLSQSLGDEYAFLAPKLAPALESAFSSALAPLQQQIQRTAVENEYNRAVAELNAETKGGYGQVEQKISDLMDVMKPAPGVPLKTYLANLYRIAGGPAPSVTQGVQKVVNRMVQNANERIPSPSAATENKIVKGPKLPTVDEAVLAAMRGETFE